MYTLHYESTRKMEPQCHPERSRARTETDLQAEQDEFFISGSANCVKLLSNRSETFNKSPSVAVLDEVIERPSGSTVKAPQAPVPKAALKPTKIAVKKPEEPEDIKVTLDKISQENDAKLAGMSSEQIEELRNEVLESVPESFLEKLRNKPKH